MPALDPTMPVPLPLPDDWAKNYRSATEQMSCSDVTASNLIVYPTATTRTAAASSSTSTAPRRTTIEMWVTAP